MTIPSLRKIAILAPILFLAGMSMDAQQSSRITGAIESGRRVALSGRVPRNARQQNDMGRVESAFPVSGVTLFLRPGGAGQAALAQLLREQQDPSSPNYHKWLTPEQYADQFGAAQGGVDQIVDWLKAQGFDLSRVARGRNWITVNGTAAQIANAF